MLASRAGWWADAGAVMLERVARVCVRHRRAVVTAWAVALVADGQGVAILIDATIVRLVVVPATMELRGGANWWLPRWLDRLIPHLAVEHRPAPVYADVPVATQTRGDGGFQPERSPARHRDDARTARSRRDPPRATTTEPAPTTDKGSR